MIEPTISQSTAPLQPGLSLNGGPSRSRGAPVDTLEFWLRRGAAEVFTVTVNMTPDLAGRLLARNENNRTLRIVGASRTVEAYARAMIRGEWLLNGESIIVSREGLLNDGQHRLEAVIKSGVGVPMQITFGVERDSRHTVDQGAARSPGDILVMYGERNAHQLAHALQFLWVYDGHRIFGYRPSTDELLATLEANPGIRDAVRAVGHLVTEFRGSAGYLAGAHLVCSRVDAGLAARFLERVSTGLGIAETGSPIFRLRKRLQDHLAKRDNVPAIEQAALYIKAFNAVRQRRNVRNLVWRRNGDAAEDFPVAGA
jgi:hypothetical protein